MRKIIIVMMFVFSFLAFADEREAHGNFEDERICSKEIRQLGCGRPENHLKFFSCVDQRVKELSLLCQTFHKEEKERVKGHSH